MPGAYLKLAILVATIAWCHCLPAKETSTRRYNFTNGIVSYKTRFVGGNKISSTTSNHLVNTLIKPQKVRTSSTKPPTTKASDKNINRVKVFQLVPGKTNSNNEVQGTTARVVLQKLGDSTSKYFNVKVINTTPVTPSLVWPSSSIEDYWRYKNFTKSYAITRKPIVLKVPAKWSEKHGFTKLRESWSESGIPIPTPNPQIFTHTPEAIVDGLSSEGDNKLPNPLNEFVLDLNEDSQEYSSDEENLRCPSVHLTNAVLGPTAKQGCADLNIAINTHVHQGTATLRTPAQEAAGGQPLQAPAVVEDSAEPLDEVAPEVLLSPAEEAPLETAALAPDAASAAAQPATGGSGGGLPGGIGFPELPGFPQLPDLSGLLRLGGLLGGLWRILSNALRFISPLLYIIPLIGFALGFILVLPFYPWWLPVLLVALKKKQPETQPVEVVFHKHVHKPIHHYDDLYWDRSKHQDASEERVRNNDLYSHLESLLILKSLDQFNQRYKYHTHNSHGWKKRKK